MSTWREKIDWEMKAENDSWENVEFLVVGKPPERWGPGFRERIPLEPALTPMDELNREFDDDFGAIEGAPFCLWTYKRVYFPTSYDGSEGVMSVSRNPDGEVVNHE
jgi:hypothetical protein